MCSRVQRTNRHDWPDASVRHGPHRRSCRSAKGLKTTTLSSTFKEINRPLIPPASRTAQPFDEDTTCRWARSFSDHATTGGDQNPNNVKMVTDREGFALFFSRSPSPIYRDSGRTREYTNTSDSTPTRWLSENLCESSAGALRVRRKAGTTASPGTRVQS